MMGSEVRNSKECIHKIGTQKSTLDFMFRASSLNYGNDIQDFDIYRY